MSILNESRENTEKFIDYLYHNFKYCYWKKPRDYQQSGRANFLSYTKKRRPGLKFRRKSIRKQLSYLKRNIGYIVEIRFEVAKRRYGLGLIKSKLKETGQSDVFLSILVLNLEKLCARELAEIRNRYKIVRKKAA